MDWKNKFGLDRKYGYGKTEYGIRYHLLLTHHVITRMRNVYVTYKYGDCGTPNIFGTVKVRHFIFGVYLLAWDGIMQSHYWSTEEQVCGTALHVSPRVRSIQDYLSTWLHDGTALGLEPLTCRLPSQCCQHQRGCICDKWHPKLLQRWCHFDDTAVTAGKPDLRRRFRLGTWNVLTLTGVGYQTSLVRELARVAVSIAGITECRIPGSGTSKIRRVDSALWRVAVTNGVALVLPEPYLIRPSYHCNQSQTGSCREALPIDKKI